MNQKNFKLISWLGLISLMLFSFQNCTEADFNSTKKGSQALGNGEGYTGFDDEKNFYKISPEHICEDGSQPSVENVSSVVSLFNNESQAQRFNTCTGAIDNLDVENIVVIGSEHIEIEGEIFSLFETDQEAEVSLSEGIFSCIGNLGDYVFFAKRNSQGAIESYSVTAEVDLGSDLETVIFDNLVYQVLNFQVEYNNNIADFFISSVENPQQNQNYPFQGSFDYTPASGNNASDTIHCNGYTSQ